MGKYIGHGYDESEKLLTQIEDYLKEPPKAGEMVFIKEKNCERFTTNPEREESFTVKEVCGDYLVVNSTEHSWVSNLKIPVSVCRKSTMQVGANPFPKDNWRKKLHVCNFSLESMILRFFKDEKYRIKTSKGEECPVKPLNWNPFVYDKDGNKEYYQRDFCWSLKDKQLLIDSIYNGISCGMIVVRMRSNKFLKSEAEKGEKEVYEWDIVDGKQRLHTIWEFMTNQFQDSYGNYWDDLSERARWEFEDTMCIGYGELDEQCSDEDTLKTFLNVNFTGVPMSQDHIDYVKEIYRKI